MYRNENQDPNTNFNQDLGQNLDDARCHHEMCCPKVHCCHMMDCCPMVHHCPMFKVCKEKIKFEIDKEYMTYRDNNADFRQYHEPYYYPLSPYFENFPHYQLSPFYPYHYYPETR